MRDDQASFEEELLRSLSAATDAEDEDEDGAEDVEDSAPKYARLYDKDGRVWFVDTSAAAPTLSELVTRPFDDEYDPNQPRAPAGTAEGGQWVKGGGGVASTKGELVPQKSSGVPVLQQTKTETKTKVKTPKTLKLPGMFEVAKELLEKAEPELEVRDPETGELLGKVKPSELPDPIAEQLKGALSPELKELTKEDLEKIIAEEKVTALEQAYEQEAIKEAKAKMEAEAIAKIAEVMKPGDYSKEFLTHVVEGPGGLEDATGESLAEYMGDHPHTSVVEALKGYIDKVTNGQGSSYLKQQADYIIHDDPDSFEGPIYESPKWQAEAAAKSLENFMVADPKEFSKEYLEHLAKDLEDYVGDDKSMDVYTKMLANQGKSPLYKEYLSGYLDWASDTNNYAKMAYEEGGKPGDFEGSIFEKPVEIPSPASKYNPDWLTMMVKKTEEQFESDVTYEEWKSNLPTANYYPSEAEAMHAYLEHVYGNVQEELAEDPVNAAYGTPIYNTSLKNAPPEPEFTGAELRKQMLEEKPELEKFDPKFDPASKANEYLDAFKNHAEPEEYAAGKRALTSYTEGSRKFNEPLRDQAEGKLVNLSKKMLNAIDAMDTILEGSHVTDNMLLYRGVGKHLMNKIEEAYTLGKNFIDPAYVSASTDHYTARYFARDDTGRGKVYPVVVTPGAYALPVKHWSMNPGENEVVLARRSRFRVRKTLGGVTYLEVVPNVD